MKGAVSNSEKALAAMQKACSGRELSIWDIRRRIERFSLTNSQVEEIVASLLKDKFVDEERYAKAFVRDRCRFGGWGESKIRWALKNKKISEEHIELALQEISQEEEPIRLREILEKRVKSYSPKEDRYGLKAKLIRFSLSRGFSYDITYTVVDKILSNFVEEQE